MAQNIRASCDREDVMFKVMRSNRHLAGLSITEEVLGKLRPGEWRNKLRFATSWKDARDFRGH